MNDFRNLAELAERSAERLGERTSLVFNGEKVTNVTVLGRARRLQRAFEKLGLSPGDIAAVCMVNHPVVNSVFGAGFRAGVTMVPVMFQLSASELRYIFSHTEARCVITDAMLIEKVREAVKDLPHIKWVAVHGGGSRPDANPPEYALDELLQEDEQPVFADSRGDDVALMLYTSGTTGKPKGVMLTHDNLAAQARATLEAGELDHRPHPLIAINALPMAHIFGIGVMNFSYMIPKEYEAGYTVQEAWFDAERFMSLIQEHRCTDIAAVPTMLALIMSHPNLEQYDLTSVVKVDVGAAPVPEDLARRFSEICGCRIRQLYGMTENAGVATSDRISQSYRPGSAGLPYPGVELRIVNENDNELPPGEPGEIVTRGPTTMKGYYKQPEATTETMKGGWLHTGDIGYVDEEGWLFVVDRKKDMIIKGGENIFPAEVESAIYTYPGVAEAAVVGIPHAALGEDVVAYVVAKGGAELEPQSIIDHVKAEITPFKAPSIVKVVPELPKSGVGKILRRTLRDDAREEFGGDQTEKPASA